MPNNIPSVAGVLIGQVNDCVLKTPPASYSDGGVETAITDQHGR